MGPSTDRFSSYIQIEFFQKASDTTPSTIQLGLGLSSCCLAELPQPARWGRGNAVLQGQEFCFVFCIPHKKNAIFVIFRVFILPAIPVAAFAKFKHHSLPKQLVRKSLGQSCIFRCKYRKIKGTEEKRYLKQGQDNRSWFDPLCN